MIYFFRKIRRDLIANSQTYKYLKYAVGEVILVMLGILMALYINNWNEQRKNEEKELSLLANLKNDLNSDILYFQRFDSMYAKIEVESEMAIKLFYKAKTIKDIDSVHSLTKIRYNEIKINHNTYDEMLNLGMGYSMKNKELQKFITDYYLWTDLFRIYIQRIITGQTQLWQVPEVYPYRLLTSQLESPQIDLKLIDTSWIGNPKSPTYLVVNECLTKNQSDNNVYRRGAYQHYIKYADSLKAAITDELEIRNK